MSAPAGALMANQCSHFDVGHDHDVSQDADEVEDADVFHLVGVLTQSRMGSCAGYGVGDLRVDADSDEAAVQGVYGVLREFFELFGCRVSECDAGAFGGHQAIAARCEARCATRASRRSPHGVHSSTASSAWSMPSITEGTCRNRCGGWEHPVTRGDGP